MSIDETRFISADGHVMEPADLWVTRMDKRFRDRAPRIESREDADYLLIEGLAPAAVTDLIGTMANEKAEGKPILARNHNRYVDVRAGALDPLLRLKDQDLDNLSAEVVYPNDAMFIYAARDAEYRRECLRAYNTWLGEYCSAAPSRILGAGMLPGGEPIQWSIEEAQRCAKLGLKSVMLPADLPRVPYGDPLNAPLWSALQDLGMPVAFHNAASERIDMEQFPSTAGGTMMATVHVKIAGQLRTFCSLISSGVAASYPKVRFVIVEGGIGWIAAVTRLMDHWWEDHHHWLEPKLDEPPSFYARRQFHHTFEDDKAGLMHLPMLNADGLMWGSDYPHTEGTFPHSREQIAKDFADLSAEVKRKIIRDNAARLYGIQ
jgi:predicted TIM-barrel fold metal-dependent hydrolase